METISQQAANPRESRETDQRWAGDLVTQAITPGAETVALAGSAETAQFQRGLARERTDYSFVPMD